MSIITKAYLDGVLLSAAPHLTDYFQTFIPLKESYTVDELNTLFRSQVAQLRHTPVEVYRCLQPSNDINYWAYWLSNVVIPFIVTNLNHRFPSIQAQLEELNEVEL